MSQDSKLPNSSLDCSEIKHLNKMYSKPLRNLIADAAVTKMPIHSTRRRFLQSAGVGMAGVALTACGNDSDSSGRKPFSEGGDSDELVEFIHGIASGDPLSDRVILWTRVTPSKNIDVKVVWEIATDNAMNNVINRGTVTTSAKDDYTVKVDADGLKPNSVYYYRFSANKVSSIIGRTKTLPVGDVTQVKLAVFSCANYPAGHFHAYADAAKRNDIDAAVHLGDYIYEYGRYAENNAEGGREAKDSNGNPVPAYASSNAEALNRQVSPEVELTSIMDYRMRHAQYKTDADLQALHAAMPMIVVWDDHEISNDGYAGGAENHQEKDGQWDARKMAAMTAFHEWLPTRNHLVNEIYRSFDFGNLLSLHMMDTRIIGRDKQLDYKDYLVQTTTGVTLDSNKFTADLTDANRHLIGLAQHNWLTQQMQQSKATWQLLGQQVIMARMSIPAPILLNIFDANLGVDLTTYIALSQKPPKTLTEEEKAILAQPSIPYNLDAWDGYYMARENVLGVARALKKNLVVLSGDTHNAWASNLTDYQGNSVGVEFATSSVSSPGFEEYVPNVSPEVIAQIFPTLVESGTLKFMDASQRGYMIVTATPKACQSDWIFVSDILKKQYTAKVGKSLSVAVNKKELST